MRPIVSGASVVLALLTFAAAPVRAAGSTAGASAAAEPHLAEVTQLTFGGENAEAYWSPDGARLVFQARSQSEGCDQIYVIDVPPLGGAGDGDGASPPEPEPVSSGAGRTTCAYFTWPEAERILYSSTHLAGPECPPSPDHSQGYVWPVFGSYEIFVTSADGANGDGALVRLTDNDAYDAEATVCPADGSIVFTSDRDGDLELYRMDADGGNVKRLTDTPGYDGGAFFSADCSKIVWRASRPREGEELEDYRRLLEQHLVRPGKLEIWVADADGSEPRQVTYLDAASFAPYFYPSGERIVFSSNYGNDSPREFDLWAVDVQGTRLERITHSEGFDGFPMFSPDGGRLAFSSNRDQGAPGETNVFVARWVDGAPRFEPRGPDRYLADVAWLADDARIGRGVETDGLAAAADWLEARFREIGVEPAFADGDGNGSGGYRQPIEVPVAVEVEEATAVSLDGEPLADDAFRPLAFSTSGEVAAEVVPAGYGVTAPDHGVDDYEGVDVEGKIALVRRFLPAGGIEGEAERRRYSDLRYKAFNAREHGAVGLIVTDLPAEGAEEGPEDSDAEPDEARFPALTSDLGGEAGLPAVVVAREAARPLFAGGGRAGIAVRLVRRTRPAVNVAGVIPAGAPTGSGGEAGAIVVGAHYDHLGMGGRGSMAPGEEAIHNGADDNASGVAALLEAARVLAARRGVLGRDVYLVAFAGEESGLLGSTRFTREPPPGLDLDRALAMINMDMVGRLRGNALSVLGGESAAEWDEIVEPACAGLGLGCTLGGDGYGPSDHTPFYAAGVPVLHLFTGVHFDYHKPSDDTATINAAGGAQVARLAAELALRLSAREGDLTYRHTTAPPPSTGDSRSFGASLGTVPDYTGPPGGGPGVLLAGVRPGSAAENAGLLRGDVLVGLAGREIGDIYDFVYILRDAKPGETVTAVVLRDGERVEVKVTFGESSR